MTKGTTVSDKSGQETNNTRPGDTQTTSFINEVENENKQSVV